MLSLIRHILGSVKTKLNLSASCKLLTLGLTVYAISNKGCRKQYIDCSVIKYGPQTRRHLGNTTDINVDIQPNCRTSLFLS